MTVADRDASARFAARLTRCMPAAELTAWNTNAGTISAIVVNPSLPVATATVTKTIQAVPIATSTHPDTFINLRIFPLLYTLVTRMMSHNPSTPNPAWKAYGASIAGEMNEALRRIPSADTKAIQASENSSATTDPIHHHIPITSLSARARPARRASS